MSRPERIHLTSSQDPPRPTRFVSLCPHRKGREDKALVCPLPRGSPLPSAVTCTYTVRMEVDKLMRHPKAKKMSSKTEMIYI